MPDSHNDQVVSQFSQQAESYARLTSATPNTDKRLSLRELAKPAADDLLLDVCCGPGTMTLDLAPFVAHVTGIDLTPAMLDQARAAQARLGITNATWMAGDINALPFADDHFAIVLCGSAFHHLVDLAPAFAELVRVCRPGGRVVVRDVTPAAAKSKAYDRMEILRDPSHVHALSCEELGALGQSLPVSGPRMVSHITADLRLDDVLATSFPEVCTIDDIKAEFLDDAIAGNDELGFSARLIDGEVRVSYALTTAVWVKR